MSHSETDDHGLLDAVTTYHQRTKHHLGRFARSLGFMDWDTQPDPFRRYHGAPLIVLDEVEPGTSSGAPTLDEVYAPSSISAVPTGLAFVSQLLYDALGLSAWKVYGGNRWSLRCNPSSGNLHPTEGYLVAGPDAGLGEAGVFHYSPYLHALERLAVLPDDLWPRLTRGLPEGVVLVGLTSIHWREAWKYGERAYRYCQHDVGHAIAALGYAAAPQGWQTRLLDSIGDVELGLLLGVGDQSGPEREHPDGLLAMAPAKADELVATAAAWKLDEDVASALAELERQGQPNRLSPAHQAWPIIDEVAEACRKPSTSSAPEPPRPTTSPAWPAVERRDDARALFRSRRSAVAMDGRSSIDVSTFLRILSAVLVRAGAPPLAALPWEPAVHLMLFVHRVHGLAPGLYALVRDAAQVSALQRAMDDDFVWERPDAARDQAPDLPLYLLFKGDTRRIAETIACGQDIASRGAFAVSMVAEFHPRLERHGPWFYRRLFWEAGAIGQALYIEAEAAGVRGTGIGCFFDDVMHELLGLDESINHQALYHFTVGGPVEDHRLGTAPAYEHRAVALAKGGDDMGDA